MIQETNNIQKNSLGLFSQMAFSFFIILVLLSTYQHTFLYLNGVTASILNQSFGLNLLNQFGFTAILSLFLVFIYYLLEKRKFNLGKKIATLIFVLIFSVEFLLIQYFLNSYDLIGSDISTTLFSIQFGMFEFLIAVAGISLLIFLFIFISKRVKFFNRFTNNLFPFSIILFVFSLGSAFVAKKPINQNKTQYLLIDSFVNWFDTNSYEGTLEYPLLKEYSNNSGLASYFTPDTIPPNIFILMIDGLGNDFVGKKAKYKKFTPFLNQLVEESLFFTNHLSNSQDNATAMTSLVGALPFGENGFTRLNNPINRNTLFSVLRLSGYQTSYYYGGNNTLDNVDKFLFEERVDLVIDKSNFGAKYQLSPNDRAGNSKGYTDGALFSKWEESYLPSTKPKFEVIQNLSTDYLVNIPDEESYIEIAEDILERSNFRGTDKRAINRKIEFFASMVYTDIELSKFYERLKESREFNNSIVIITGTKSTPILRKKNKLQEYAVPLLIHSPLIHTSHQFENLTSHYDIAPSIVNLLKANYGVKTNTQHAWLGQDLLLKADKNIPLFKRKGRINDFVLNNHYYKEGKLFTISNDLNLTRHDNAKLRKTVLDEFKRFKAINSYVTTNNKIVPDSLTIYPFDRMTFTDEELVWVNSVFNGNDFDNAYDKARKMSHKGNHERALLLCDYILSQVPNHIDAIVLKGRIYAWKHQYAKAMEVLERAILKNPTYHDAYSAYLDVCFWSGDYARAGQISKKMTDNQVQSVELMEKLNRCLNRIEFDAQDGIVALKTFEDED